MCNLKRLTYLGFQPGTGLQQTAIHHASPMHKNVSDVSHFEDVFAYSFIHFAAEIEEF